MDCRLQLTVTISLVDITGRSKFNETVQLTYRPEEETDDDFEVRSTAAIGLALDKIK